MINKTFLRYLEYYLQIEGTDANICYLGPDTIYDIHKRNYPTLKNISIKTIVDRNVPRGAAFIIDHYFIQEQIFKFMFDNFPSASENDELLKIITTINSYWSSNRGVGHSCARYTHNKDVITIGINDLYTILENHWAIFSIHPDGYYKPLLLTNNALKYIIDSFLSATNIYSKNENMETLKVGDKVTFKIGSRSKYEIIYIESGKGVPIADPMICFKKFGRYNILNTDQLLITIPKSLVESLFQTEPIVK